MRSSESIINDKHMENLKRLGIWMDHSNAYLMEFSNGQIVTDRVALESTDNEAEFNSYKGEKHINIKEQHLQLSYYKKIGEVIKKYHDVLLFGPTDAKSELMNLVKTDHLFEGIKIEVKNSGKMTEDQMQIFIREYFK